MGSQKAARCRSCHADLPLEQDRCPVCGVSRSTSAKFARQVWVIMIIFGIVTLVAMAVLYAIVSRLGVKD